MRPDRHVLVDGQREAVATVEPGGSEERESVGLMEPEVESTKELAVGGEQLPRLGRPEPEVAQALMCLLEQPAQAGRVLTDIRTEPVGREVDGHARSAVVGGEPSELVVSDGVSVAEVAEIVHTANSTEVPVPVRREVRPKNERDRPATPDGPSSARCGDQLIVVVPSTGFGEAKHFVGTSRLPNSGTPPTVAVNEMPGSL